MGWDVQLYKTQNLRLQELMKEQGYSLHTLAEASGVSEKTLYCMRQGRLYPRLDSILLVCKALNCTIDTLYPIDVE